MLTAIDLKLFNIINKTIANKAFDFIMPVISMLGSGEAIFILACILIIVAVKKSRRKTPGVLLLAGLTISYYAVYILKNFFARPRPFMAIPDVCLLGLAEKGFSFPSGHATTIFMAAAVLSGFFKKRWLFFSFAVLVGFSRVYMGVHYPSDIIAGALLGLVIGYGLKRLISI